ncbi:Fe2OG dioxygenase domain-containing protein [Citrus sinensis]|uniref:Fe2OG dioxygenase domain-containing protein n=1 Tax=Citrus sinensis TaxID=2711 RepID=A0ACB8HVA9_CITSI|nr:Fe2OG dioxygenase domain-containing protein [Citrus sinensis]
MSSDVHKPARYGTRLRDGADKIQFWRVFLKHYASPLEDWIGSWPKNPPKHRCAQVPVHNAYSLFNCPFEPNFSFSSRCLTIVLQSSEGLEFLGKEDESWRKVPNVHVGDHLEVLSNGIYKSVVHRATLNHERTRISITSLHSLHSLGVCPHVKCRSNLSHSLEDYLMADRDLTRVVVTDRDLTGVVVTDRDLRA